MRSSRLLAWPALYGGAVFGGIFWALLTVWFRLLESRSAGMPLVASAVAFGVAVAGAALNLVPRGWAHVAGGTVAVGALLGLPVLAYLAVVLP